MATSPGDLTKFLGSPDDTCPVCLEVMPVLSWRGDERCRSLCCGKFMCPDCMAHIQGHQESLEKEAIDAAIRNERFVAEKAMKAMETMGTCPLCRAKLPTTPEQAFAALLKNAEKGLASDQHAVGTNYESGNGTRKNLKEAAKWFKKSTEQGHPWSPLSYGYLLQMGEGGVHRDIAKAKLLYEISIEFGQPQGYQYLGDLYVEGIGVEKNEKEAVRLYRVAAEMGLDVAQCALGNCYNFGTGVAVNDDEALKWYLTSAKQGKNATAMNNAGAKIVQLFQMKNDSKLDVPGQDPFPRAYHWFKQAAKLGDVSGASTASQIEANYKHQCAQCEKSALAAKLSRCAKCHLYHYCSRSCQVAHWKAGHSKDCVKAD